MASTLQAEAQLQPLRPFLRSEASHYSVGDVGTIMGENVPVVFAVLEIMLTASAALLRLFCHEQPASIFGSFSLIRFSHA